MPYTTYATGIMWRNDKVSEDIASMQQPWDIFWQAQDYKGKTALLSEDRETIAMALLRKGITDINTEDPKLINQAVADLKELYGICNIKVGDVQYQAVPEGTAWLNQAWSGDIICGLHLLSARQDPVQHALLLEGAQGARSGAERLLQHLLDHEEAGPGPSLPELDARKRHRILELLNFNGYQPPLNEIEPNGMLERLRKVRNASWGTNDTAPPENLSTSILTNEDFGPDSLQEMTLSSAGNALWQNGYSNFQTGG